MRAIAISLLVCGCAAVTPAAKTVLEVAAPAIVEALTQLVKERWGDDARVDRNTAGCFRASAGVAELVGDDDREYVYVVCRAKAVGR